MHPGYIDGRVSLTSTHKQLSVGMVKINARQKGNRRWDLPHEFPLVDCQGVLVMYDRRILADRRKNPGELDDLMVILSRMSTRRID
jgi:hypothetical protein